MSKYLLVFLVFLISNNVIAQREGSQLYVGYVYSNMVGDDDANLKPRSGFHVGLTNREEIFYNLYYETGLTYTKYGATSSFDSLGFRLNYINMPLLFRYNIYYGFNAHLGVEPAFLLKNKIDGIEEDGYFSYETIVPLDFRYTVGIGYEHSSGLCLNLYYKVGLVNLGKTFENRNPVTGNTFNDRLRLKNNALILTLSTFSQ